MTGDELREELYQVVRKSVLEFQDKGKFHEDLLVCVLESVCHNISLNSVRHLARLLPLEIRDKVAQIRCKEIKDAYDIPEIIANESK